MKKSIPVLRSALLLCALAAALLPRPVASQQTTRPDPLAGAQTLPILFDWVRTPLPVAYVRINGSEPLPFVLDTGTSTALVVDDRTAERLQLKRTIYTARVNDSFSIPGVQVDSVSLTSPSGAGKVELPKPPMAFRSDLSLLDKAIGGVRIAGLIGAPLLEPYTVRFDFSAPSVSILSRTHAPLRPAGATVLPLRARDHRYFVRLEAVPGSPAELLVDTGATRSALPVSVTSRLKPLSVRMTGVGKLEAAFIVDELLLAELPLGAHTLRQATVHTDPVGDELGLGINLMRRFRVTFDFRNRELVMERPEDFGPEPVDGGNPLNLELRQGAYYILAADPGTAAAASGLKAGDRLLEVDGFPVDGEASWVVDRLLGGLAGTTAVLTLQRGEGERLTVRYPRRSSFEEPQAPYHGFMLRHPTKKAITVMAVRPGSPADRAGIRTGDEIIRLNGRRANLVPVEHLRDELWKWSLDLEIRRKGAAGPLTVRVNSAPDQPAAATGAGS